jgi:DNA-directed RNA polymerase subunit RPC12/RpoP
MKKINISASFLVEQFGTIYVESNKPALENVLPQVNGIFMIHFSCENCGRKLKITDTFSGKKIRCPKCKNPITIPEAPPPKPAQAQKASKTDSKITGYDLTLLDAPDDGVQTQVTSKSLNSIPQNQTELEQESTTEETETPGKRRLLWIIDIFLYPISKPGSIMLGLIILVPLFIKILGKTLSFAALGFPPLLIIATIVVVVGIFIRVILWLYFYWYFCECIRGSASGQSRAPETISNAPGLGDMLLQLLKILACLVVFFAPVLIRFQYTRTVDVVFWILLSYAVFFFPMGLLAVVMFDSVSGLNPVLLIGSLFSTFLQYCGLIFILVFCTAVLILKAAPNTQGAPVLAFLLRCICIYLMLVGAHLLGRFYWRYQKNLNWEV